MREERFPLFAISRLRMVTDGAGVTTLVAARGCPLRCRYCLNPESLQPGDTWITPGELYDRVKIDDLYFQATGGGVTFGGGEPLLNAAFIAAFRERCGDAWRLRAETSLNVPEENVDIGSQCLDEWIVDIKDMDPEIYQAYTGISNARVHSNLRRLLSLAGPDRILIRVPEIPGYNTAESVGRSVDMLKEMGFTRFDRFCYRTAHT